VMDLELIADRVVLPVLCFWNTWRENFYSNTHRGKVRKTGVSSSHPLIIEEEERFVVSRGWAEMIKKIYEVDPLLCPRCGGQMSILTFIEEPKVIDKITRSPQSDFLCRTTSLTSNCPTGTLDGSRRDRRVLLRPFMTAFLSICFFS